MLLATGDMEQQQELQLLDKVNMADIFDDSNKNEVESWYKVVVKTDAQEIIQSSSHSEDELNMSPGTGTYNFLAKPKPIC